MTLLGSIAERIESAKKTTINIRITNMNDSHRLGTLLNAEPREAQIAFLHAFMQEWQNFENGRQNDITELCFAHAIPSHKLCWYEPHRESQLTDERTFILAFYPNKPHIPAQLHFCQPLCTLKGPPDLIKEIKPALTQGMVKVHSKDDVCRSMYVYEE